MAQLLAVNVPYGEHGAIEQAVEAAAKTAVEAGSKCERAGCPGKGDCFRLLVSG